MNTLADWLSRGNKFNKEDDEIVNQISIPVGGIVSRDFQLLQDEKDLRNEKDDVLLHERRQCYEGEDGLLYSARTNKLFIPRCYRSIILHWGHGGEYGGHRGINATTRTLRKLVWWPNLHKDVKDYCRNCLPCTRNRPPARSTISQVLKKPVAMDLISIDYVGPREVNKIKWWYLVVIDHCTRMVYAHVTKRADTNTVLYVLKQIWIPLLGIPKAVLTDNAAVFVVGLKEYVIEELRSYMVYTSPYYPQGNSINESCHRVLEHHVKIQLQLGETDFPRIVSKSVLMYNSTYQSVIRDAPYMLMFGKTPLMPGFQNLAINCSEEQRAATLKDAYERRVLSQLQIEHNLEVGGQKIKVGDVVLYYLGDGERKQRIGGVSDTLKYQPLWSYPAKVKEVRDQQISVEEYFTGFLRKVPLKQVHLLEGEVLDPQVQLNWQHIQHTIPKRVCCDFRTSIPPQYKPYVEEPSADERETSAEIPTATKDESKVQSRKRMKSDQ